MIALVDIDDVKRRELETETARRRALAIVQAVGDALVVFDGELNVQMVNDAFCRLFGVEPHEATGKQLYDLGDGLWKAPHLRSLVDHVLRNESQSQEIEIEHDWPGRGRTKLFLHARRVENRDDHLPLALLAIREV